MTLLDWIKKNAVDGADLAEAEKLVNDLDPLKNLTTLEDTLSFMKRNDLFQKALDSETSIRVSHSLDRFKETKLPDLLKEEADRIRKAANPDEDPRDKRIRELEERQADSDRKASDNARKIELRTKAKELAEAKDTPYDPLRAERLYVYGDEAFNVLEDEIGYFKSAIDKQLEAKLKGQYTAGAPKASTPTGRMEDMSDAELNRLAIDNPSQKPVILEEITRRLRPSL